MQNLFSFKTPFKFENPSTGSGDIPFGARDLFPLCFQRETQKKKRGKDCLVMIYK